MEIQRSVKKRNPALLAWMLFAVAILGILNGIVYYLRSSERIQLTSSSFENFFFAAFLAISAVIGALIISRHPRNMIGWLLMFYSITAGLTSPLDSIKSSMHITANPTLSQYLTIWLTGWDWWLLMGPFLLIPLLFPTGKLISIRWKWVPITLLSCFLMFLFLATFSPTLDVNNSQIANPLGFIPNQIYSLLLIFDQLLLAASAIGCVASIFIRYRRSSGEEREQIKWLLYACAIFLVVYLIGFLLVDNAFTQNSIWTTIFSVVIAGIPLAIGAAILRYHLWDIDLIINRTLVYVPLTAILAGLYSATIALVQKLLIAITGQKSDAAVVMTTFMLVAAFTPIKNGLQQFVDKRFKESSSSYKAIHALEDQVRSVMEVLDINLITQRLLATAVEAFHASGGAVYLSQGDQMRVVHATPGWTEENRRLSMPLEWEGRQLGLLSLGSRKSGISYSSRDLNALQRATSRVAWAIMGSMLTVEE